MNAGLCAWCCGPPPNERVPALMREIDGELAAIERAAVPAASPGSQPAADIVSAVVDHTGEVICCHRTSAASPTVPQVAGVVPALKRAAAQHCVGSRAASVHIAGAGGSHLRVFERERVVAVVLVQPHRGPAAAWTGPGRHAGGGSTADSLAAAGTGLVPAADAPRLAVAGTAAPALPASMPGSASVPPQQDVAPAPPPPPPLPPPPLLLPSSPAKAPALPYTAPAATAVCELPSLMPAAAAVAPAVDDDASDDASALTATAAIDAAVEPHMARLAEAVLALRVELATIAARPVTVVEVVATGCAGWRR